MSSGLHAAEVHGQVHERILPVQTAALRLPLPAWQPAAKRALDVVLSLLTLLAALPVLAVAGLAIWLCDRGPVFFRQERVGLQGKTFRMYKLRTMSCGAEAQQAALAAANARVGPLFKMADDPRVTPVGRFLRASSIDELPQLWNVLRGEMSLVGPRPSLASETAQFDRSHLRRLEVKPGITGLWQVEARDSVDFDEFARLDLRYVDTWSFGVDVVLLARTAVCVAQRVLRVLRRDPGLLA